MGNDGNIRRVRLSYRNFKIGEPVSEYSGAQDTIITRAVQRLALLVSEDEVNPSIIKKADHHINSHPPDVLE